MGGRRTITVVLALALVGAAAVTPQGAGATPAEGAITDADPSEVLDLRGDFLVRADGGPPVLVPEPPVVAARVAGGLLNGNLEGFRSWNATSGNRGAYTVRLVTSPDVEQLRPLARTVASELTSITGSTVAVGAGQVGTIEGPIPDGEIRVTVSDAGPCPGATVIGCGEIQTTNGVGMRGRVWITTAGMDLTDARRTSLLRHEIGHALGLEHYQPTFGGQAQVMASGLGEARPYGTGDRNGLRFLAPMCQDRPADVATSSPFCDEAGWTVRNGILAGYPDGTYRPAAPVSRQAMAAMLHRFAGSPPAAGAPGFSDVPSGHRFATAIAWLVQQGIAQGYDDGTFRPTDPVSRQAMASFLHGYLLWANGGSIPSGQYLRTFLDVPVGHRFRTPIQSLAGHLVVQGSHLWTGSSWGLFFQPTAPVSRQAAAAFLFRSDNLMD